MKKIFTILFFIFALVLTNQAQVTYGPTSDPPEGVFTEVVGDLHDQLIGRPAGKDITFSAITFANKTRVFFGTQVDSIKLSLDGGDYSGVGEILTYDSVLSVPVNGYLVWTGETRLRDYPTTPVYTRFVMNISNPTGPVSAIDADSVGLNSALGSVYEVVPGESFHINLQFQASYTPTARFEPHLDFYDRESVYDVLAYSSFNWGWYWHNSPPELEVNNTLTVDEGDTATIDTHVLWGTDVESDSSEVYFTVQEIPVNGTLLLNGVRREISDSISQANVDDTLSYYAHDGSETTADSIGLRLSDGDGAFYVVGDDTTFYLQITVTPVNDPPAVVTNLALRLDEGAEEVITNTILLSEDPEDQSIMYTFDPDREGNWPANGILKLDGIPLSAGDQFTQVAIDAGSLAYKHDGTESTVDGFLFSIADSDGHSTEEILFFEIEITPVNDAPRFTANTSTEVTIWETTVITTNNINASDEESSAENVYFVIPADRNPVTDYGTISVDGVELLTGGSFTVQDLIDGKVTYFTNEQVEKDEVLFEIYDEDGAVASDAGFTVFKHIFNVTLTEVNVEEAASFNIFPNPGNGYFQLTWQGSFDSYKVMNTIGQVIKNEIIQGQSSMNLDLTEYRTGLYILHMNNSEGQNIIRKLIIK